jgi:uracil-DNA glycosylase
MIDRFFESPSQWQAQLKGEFNRGYMRQLLSFLDSQRAQNKTVYPPEQDIFAALAATPLEKLKVVILGQDPYHGPSQAHGLSFSVPQGSVVPPSLRNIYKELADDVGAYIPIHGNLMQWARQGVLLLNSVLTVGAGQAGSHQGKGWEEFTDKIIQVCNDEKRNLVFMLWGGYAQKKGQSINRQHHLVLQAPHPSPLSAYRGFFGCKHFSQANTYLQTWGYAPINWQIQ